ncbi:MAG TPA: DUF2914 domain-containing protein [Burkholderiales bacterium]|nr:DUF2914 domain-containing protein [Burkholderiales bacterium]
MGPGSRRRHLREHGRQSRLAIGAHPQEEALSGSSGLERLRLYYSRNESRVAAAFFAAGFVFDMLTVGRIDSWVTIGQQLAYLLVIMAVLLHMFSEQGSAPADISGRGIVVRRYYEYRSAVVHFLLGALLNLYAIFYFKSSSLLVSFGFLGVLVAVLLANELRRIKAFGLAVKFALLGLCFLSFSACVIPIIVGSIGLGVFLLSMLAGCVPLVAGAWWAVAKTPNQTLQARRQILVPLGCVVVGFLAFYLFRLIPPVPLSIPFMGVYHNVERTDTGYRLSHERPAWRFWHNGDQNFAARPGDKVYVFFRIFSPARFSDQTEMRWYWKDPARGWTLHDSIPIRIVGGREQGFRGYGVKSNYQSGDWKVLVETTDGREIGRVYFDLTLAPEAPRNFTSVVD